MQKSLHQAVVANKHENWRHVLLERRKELDEKFNLLNLTDKDYKEQSYKICEELDCIDHVATITGDFYEYALFFMKEHNMDTIVDIGCAYAHQSEIF